MCNYYRGRALAKCLIPIQSRYFRANEELISWKIGLLSNFYLFICILFSVKSDKCFVKIGEIANVNLYSTIVSRSALFIYERINSLKCKIFIYVSFFARVVKINWLFYKLSYSRYYRLVEILIA